MKRDSREIKITFNTRRKGREKKIQWRCSLIILLLFKRSLSLSLLILNLNIKLKLKLKFNLDFSKDQFMITDLRNLRRWQDSCQVIILLRTSQLKNYLLLLAMKMNSLKSWKMNTRQHLLVAEARMVKHANQLIFANHHLSTQLTKLNDRYH